MNEKMQSARARYKNQAVPEELTFTVASAVRSGDRKRAQKKALRRTLTTALAGCACFMLLVNTNPSFASAVSEVPVLGQLARILTVRSYTVADENRQLDVRLPALKNTGNAELEARINMEITQRVDKAIAEGEERAKENQEAFVATGGKAEAFTPVVIDVDYELKYASERYLSFVVTETETQAQSFTQSFTYNLDLDTGKELTLADVLGPDYLEKANAAVAEGIALGSQDPKNSYFTKEKFGDEAFTSIREDQRFYLNEAGNPVVVFEKYEIAPGYMGIQEFEVQK